jgi:crotonobetainyl-CoA:carnitine CoA-transferase CaiB-like acyl-CoA transferase
MSHEPASIGSPEIANSDGAVDPRVQALLNEVGLRVPPSQEAMIVGRDPILGYRFPVGEAAAVALAAGGVAASDLWELKTGRRQAVRVEVRKAAVSLRATLVLKVNDGPPPPSWADGNPLVDFYRCRDGRWVHLHGNFPHLAAGTMAVLGCSRDRQEIAAAVARRDALELEDALAANRQCGAMARTAEEWAAHPQGQALAGVPRVEILKIGDSAPEPLPSRDSRLKSPLSGVRVLDLTRILAGPTHARTLAQYGADVLHITSPTLPTSDVWVMDTNQGKLSAYLDLEQPGDVQRLRALASEADVFAQGFRAGALERRKLGPAQLAALRPGIIYVSINCYGQVGPWVGRPGWEQLAQTVTGLATEQGTPEHPKRMPVAACDYTTGYLAALGTLVALGRRAREGGSYHVRASLCQTGMWFQRLGATCDPDQASGPGDPAEFTVESDTAWGRLRHLPPAVELSETPPRWTRPVVPLGTHPPTWPPHP